MKKAFVVAVLMVGLVVCSFASGAVAQEDTGEFDFLIEALVESGATIEEAESIVAQAVDEAEEEGLEGEDLLAEVQEAVNAAQAVKDVEQLEDDAMEQLEDEAMEQLEDEAMDHPEAEAMESPLKAKPKDHPAH